MPNSSGTIFNVHSHVFAVRNVPSRFLPLGLVHTLSKSRNWRTWDSLIRHCPFIAKDVRKRVASFCRAAEHDSQRDILNDMMGFYPTGTRFVLLSMDFDHMGAGTCERDFLAQLDELASIKKAYGDLVLPFMALDPRRKGLLSLARRCIEEEGFAGFKLYPPLGYFPFEDQLGEVYDYAQSRGIPIVTHCSHAGPLVHWRGPITPQMRVHPKTGQPLTGADNRSFADNWADPKNYCYVLDAFPRLRLDLGHAGGEIEWRKYLFTAWPSKLPGQASAPGNHDTWLETVIDLIRGHEHVYADISYTAFDTELLPLLKVLLTDRLLSERFLYGSDSYMVQMDSGERHFSVGVRAFLGETLFSKIAVDNPKRWLF